MGWKIILSVISCLIFVSCERDRDRDMPVKTPVKLKLYLEEKAVSRNAPQVNETAVTDLNIYLFNEEGKLTDYTYLDSPDTEVLLDIITDRDYTIYAVANTGRLSEKETVSDIKDIEGLHWEIEKAEDIVNSYGAVPMSGKVSRRLSGDTDTLSITLTRLLSKFRLIVDISGLDADISTFDVRKVCLRNINRRVGYFTESRAVAAGDVLSSGISVEGDDLERLFSTGVDFYLPENAQGDLLSGNTDEKTHIPPEQYRDLCSFVEFEVMYRNPEHYSDCLVFRYYLHDGSLLDNFDVERNTMYTCRTVFTGSAINENSWRIDATGMKDMVTSVSVSPASRTFTKEGEQFRYTASVLPLSAENPDVVWSSDNTDVATVAQDGTVTAVSDGTCTITATAADGSGKTGKAEAVVDIYRMPESISVTPEKVQMYVGETFGLRAEILPANTTDKGVYWKSSNNRVATVNEAGRITAVSNGTAVITAVSAVNSLEDFATVTVSDKVFRIEDLPDIIYPGYNSPATIKYTAEPQCTPVFTLSVISGRSDAASVKGNIITAHSIANYSGLTGMFRLTGTGNGITDTRTFQVSQGQIAIYGDYVMLLGAPKKFTVSHSVPSDVSVTWSSSNPSVADVSQDGTVTPKSTGSCRIQATSVTGASADMYVSVSEPYFTISDISLYEGTSADLKDHINSPSGVELEYRIVSGNNGNVSLSGTTLHALKRTSEDISIEVFVKGFPDVNKVASVNVLPAVSIALKDKDSRIVNTCGYSASMRDLSLLTTSLDFEVTKDIGAEHIWDIRDSEGNATDDLSIGYGNTLTASSEEAMGTYTVRAWDESRQFCSETVTVYVYRYLDYEVDLESVSYYEYLGSERYAITLRARWSTESLRTNSSYMDILSQLRLLTYPEYGSNFTGIDTYRGSIFADSYETLIKRSGNGVLRDLMTINERSYIRNSEEYDAVTVAGNEGVYLTLDSREFPDGRGYFFIKERDERFFNEDEYRDEY